MEKLGLFPKRLFFNEFSNTLDNRDIYYYSFWKDIDQAEEIDMLFERIIKEYGSRHIPLYRLCDAEYIYTMGVKIPKRPDF